MYLNNPNNTIVIKGHTDNRPISSAVYPSNWELSTGRAGSVARYIISKFGVQPSRIVTSGLADTNPVATNDTEMGRAKNRRVEIWLLRGQANQVMNEMRDAASTATDVFGKGTFQ